jgi:hypothetical protein
VRRVRTLHRGRARTRTHRATRLLLAVLILCAAVCAISGTGRPAAAQAAESARLSATLTPERLGQGTTIGFNLRILTAGGVIPPPLREVDLRYPQDLGIATSGLGLQTCSAATLEISGPQGCPPDSVMGIGSAVAEIPVGPEIVSETAPVTIFRAPTENGQIAMVLYANGATPVDAQILLPSLLLPATAPFGGRVKIHVPLVPSLPDSPDVAVVRLTTTLGPLGITYYEREHGRTVAYRPRGLQLPGICPHRGFPFAAQLDFVGGSSATARAVVPCPGSPPPHSDRS